MLSSFDIETIEEDGKLIPICIVLYHNAKYLTFFGGDSTNQFIDEIFTIARKNKTNKKKNLIVVSHNLTFDGSILIQNIDRKITYDGIFFRGEIYSLTLINIEEKLTVKLICSFKFFPTSLDSAHLHLGTEKKIPYNILSIDKNNYTVYRNVIEEYCRRDAYIAFQIIFKFLEVLRRFDIKNMHETFSISSAALRIFSRKLNIYEVPLELPNFYDEWIRRSYHGGRCEIFGNPVSEELIYHYDFKGMYAQCMMENYSWGEMRIIENPVTINEGGFYSVECESNLIIPLLPIKNSTSGRKLLFANGKFKGVYWWEELKLFQELGGVIKKIYFKLDFKHYGPIFTEFSKKMMEAREHSISTNFFSKLMLNSLYGRLGMSPIQDETVIVEKDRIATFRVAHNKRILEEIEIGRIFIVKLAIKKEKTSNSNVALASMITSKARIKLYRAFLTITRLGGRLLYCDTDSIFAGFYKNMDNRRCDEIFWDTSKPDTKIKKACFALPKTYALILDNGREIIKFKGLPHTLTFAQFEQAFLKNITLTLTSKKIIKNNYLIAVQNIKQNINLGHYNKRAFDIIGKYTVPLSLIDDNVLTPNPLDSAHLIFLDYLKEKNIDKIPYSRNYNPFSWINLHEEAPTKRILLNTYSEINHEGLVLWHKKENIFQNCEIAHYLIITLGMYCIDIEYHKQITLINLYEYFVQHQSITIAFLAENHQFQAFQKKMIIRTVNPYSDIL